MIVDVRTMRDLAAASCIGWCGVCWKPVRKFSGSKEGTWFGCGHTNAELLMVRPIRLVIEEEQSPIAAYHMPSEPLPRAFTRAYLQRAMLDDSGMDVKAYFTALHVDTLSRRGYIPFGDIEVICTGDLLKDWEIVYLVSETAVSWKPRARQG